MKRFERSERRTNEEGNKRTKSEPTNPSSSTSSSKRQSSSSERRKNSADDEVRRKKKRDGNKGKTRKNNLPGIKSNLNSPLSHLLTILSISIFLHAASGFGFDKVDEVTGLGPRNSIDKLSEDEELEVSLTEDVEIAISRNRNNGSDSLENRGKFRRKSLSRKCS